MTGLVIRSKFEIEDRLRFSATTRRIVSHRWRRKALAMRSDTDQERIARVQKLCSAATLSPDANVRRAIEAEIVATAGRVEARSIDWTEIYPEAAKPTMYPAAILKPYVGPREKGVLVISFENQWTKLLVHCDPREVAARYTVIIGPSWTPPHSVGVTVFPRLFPDRVFSTISHDNDLQTLPRLSDRIDPLPLLASSWVDPGDFSPLPHDRRDIDIVMVATFGKYKRHHALLKALARMPSSIRVLLVGTSNPDLGKDGVEQLARAYGVRDRMAGIGPEDYAGVARAFCRSRISVIMSRREGSCQAVVESMFADTPVGILENAELGSAKFVNQHTGRRLREAHLAEDLMDMLAAARSFSARSWVMDNGVSCQASTRTLNEILREHALRRGEEWTRDAAVHAWNPYPELVRREDREALAPAYVDFSERFGLKVGPDPSRWKPASSTAAG
jgi:glycosyltransferase involved in cell wall biosynthesis